MIVALLVLAVVVAILLPMATKKKTKESFASGILENDLYSMDRAGYVDLSTKKYNTLGVNISHLNNDLIMPREENEKFNKEIEKGILTNEIYADGETANRMNIFPDSIVAKIPHENPTLKAIGNCEAVKGRRNACNKLGTAEMDNCGVCIKNGVTLEGKTDHIGGLFALARDRYYKRPTAGSCPPDFFYTNKADCVKAVNRLECKEIGESGGFENGRTKESDNPDRTMCAKVGTTNTYVFEPTKTSHLPESLPAYMGTTAPSVPRKSSVALRALSPRGSGITRINIINKAGVSIASRDMKGGEETVITIPNMGELETLRVRVAQEVPYRRTTDASLNEVFMFRGINNMGNLGIPNMTFQGAVDACERIGARIATAADIEKAWNSESDPTYNVGLQANCMPGWAADDTNYKTGKAYMPIKNGTNKPGCGSGGLNESKPQMSYAWCFGAKPPNSTRQEVMKNSVENWFTSFGDTSTPQQMEPSVFSKYGESLAPYFRGILLQWEVPTMNAQNGQQIVRFEPTVLSINGYQYAGENGNKTILKRLGTYGGSLIMASTKADPASKMMRNNFWIWSNRYLDQVVDFDVIIPGNFNKPFYTEDQTELGVLISNPDTLKLLEEPPCFKADQKPGSFSEACLMSLFLSAGGILPGDGRIGGELFRTNGGLMQLMYQGNNTKSTVFRDLDAITNYLAELSSLATTGRYANGQVASPNDSEERSNIINEAARLLFGFDISTPCETIEEDDKGNIVIKPKSVPLDVGCLNYLWGNAGSDKNRGSEGPGRRGVFATYTTIGDRYSGLRNSEGTAKERKEFPFRACTNFGKKAPRLPDGKPNSKAMYEANIKGSIVEIQKWYDSIHQKANDSASVSPNNDDQMDAHAQAVDQCYGVEKAVDPDIPDDCGIVCRYIQVIPNGGVTQYASLPANSLLKSPATVGISIESLIAKSARDRELTKGLTPQVNQGMLNDQYWRLDLGKPLEVDHVILNTKEPAKMGGARIQLLDANMMVVYSKQLSLTYGDNKIRFYKNETLPDMIGGLSFAQYLTTQTFGRHFGLSPSANGGLFVVGNSIGTMYIGASSTFTNLEYMSSTFIVRPTDPPQPGVFRFENYLNGGLFITKEGNLAKTRPNTTNNSAANMEIVGAINGDPTMVSIKVAGTSDYLCVTDDLGRLNSSNTSSHLQFRTIADAGSLIKNKPFEADKFCWKLRRPFIKTPDSIA